MKKFLKRPLLLSLLITRSSFIGACYKDVEVGVNEQQDSSSVTNLTGIRNVSVDNNEKGPYTNDFLSITYKAGEHWEFENEYKPNHNGGFILVLNGNEANKVIAKTSIIKTNKLVGNKKLVFTAKADKEQKLVFGIKDGKKEKEIIASLNTQEEAFEVFVGELDLENGLEIYVKGNETKPGEVVIRDIGFSYSLLTNALTPYTKEDTKEFLINRDFENHWELSSDVNVNPRYDDVIEMSYYNDSVKELSMKTTVIGNEKLLGLKTLTFKFREILSYSYNSSRIVKVRIGDVEEKFDYNSYIMSVSLEHINLLENFEESFIFEKIEDNNLNTKITVDRIYFTDIEVTSITSTGGNEEMDLLENNYYHVDVSDNSGKLTYENDKVSFDSSDTTNTDTYIYCGTKDCSPFDYSKLRLVVKGLQGNKIYINPNQKNTSSYSEYKTEVTLSGETQVIEIDLSASKAELNGFSIKPMYSLDNVQGKLEILEARYIDERESFKLKDHVDKVDQDRIDITKDLVNIWRHGSNATIDENEHVSVMFEKGSIEDPLEIYIKRSNEFEAFRYLRYTYKANGRYYTSTSSGSGGSGGTETGSSYVEVDYVSTGGSGGKRDNDFAYPYMLKDIKYK